MLCTVAAIVINIVNRAGSLDVCRVMIVMGIIRAVLVYVGLAMCTIFVWDVFRHVLPPSNFVLLPIVSNVTHFPMKWIHFLFKI